MSLVGVAVGGAALAYLLARLFLGTPPQRLAQLIRTVVPYGLLVAGLGLLLIGQLLIGLVAAVSGAAILIRESERRGDGRRASQSGRVGWSRTNRRRRPSWLREVPRPPPAPEASAHVRSHFLKMALEPATGELTGRVLAGTFTGRRLDQMEEDALRTLLAEVASDPESLRLLEAYLDRRMAGWRADAKAGMGDGLGRTPGTGAMTEQEAHEILGLQKGATVAEIRDAHRRLMKRVHPDHGGTDFLAARINEAKALLIDRHH